MIPALISLSLFSCAGKVDFPYTNDPAYPYLARDGELYGRGGFSSFVEESRPAFKDELIQRTNENQCTFLFLLQENCQHCQSSEHAFASFLEDSGALTYTYYAKNGLYASVRAELQDYLLAFPDLSSVIKMDSLVTPSLYLLSSPNKGLYLPFQNAWTHAQSFKEYIKGLINYTRIYDFRTFASFERFYKDNACLLFLDDGTGFYQREVKLLAEHSPKMLAYVDTRYLNETEKAKFLTFTNGNELTLIEKGGSIAASVSTKSSEAQSLLNDYYPVTF